MGLILARNRRDRRDRAPSPPSERLLSENRFWDTTFHFVLSAEDYDRFAFRSRAISAITCGLGDCLRLRGRF